MVAKPRFFLPSYHAILTSAILFLLVLFIILFSTYWYLEEQTKIEGRFMEQQELSQFFLKESTQWIDRGNYLYELGQNNDLLQVMNLFRQRYIDVDGNISRLDLLELKEKADIDNKAIYEFYLISPEGIVEQTSYPNDLGLDFKTVPEFYEKINDMRESGRFYPDRTLHGLDYSGLRRKFAYQSTPDHLWILEVSKEMDDVMPATAYNSYSELLNQLIKLYPSIKSIDLYNWLGECLVNEGSANLSKINDTSIDLVNLVYKTRKPLVLEYPEKDELVLYSFLPLFDSGAPSNDYIHLVGKTVLSTTVRDNNLFILALDYVLINSIIIILAVLLAFFLSRQITRPLNRIVEDINKIAQGDLDHQIRPTGAAETQKIENSINLMVKSLKNTISELHMSKEELDAELILRKRAEEKYLSVFETAYDAIVLISGRTIKEINPETTRLLGYREDEIILKNILDFSPPFQPDGIESYAKLEELFFHVQDIGFITAEWQFLRSDGSMVDTEVHLTHLRISVANLTQAIFHDVTIRKQAEEMLRNMNSMLEDEVMIRTRELEETVHELDSFTYSVSHDLRAPIRAIDGFAHILGMKIGELGIDDVNGYIRKIKENTRMMDHLIEDLLAFSRVSRKEISMFRIHMENLVRETLETIRGGGPKLRAEISIGPLPDALGDPSMIKQVFVNLISNAVKFTKHCKQPRVEIGSIIHNNQTVYYVRDNGVGFDMDYADKVFDVFLRLHSPSEYEGTGVGLAIVKRIIIRHGGRIWAESSERKGSTFYFTLHDSLEIPHKQIQENKNTKF